MTDITISTKITFLGEEVKFIAYTGRTMTTSGQREVHARYTDGSTFFVEESALVTK